MKKNKPFNLQYSFVQSDGHPSLKLVLDIPLAMGRRLGPLVLSVAMLAISWACFSPGILMSDTMTRWAGAFTLVGKLEIWWGLELWLAPTMTWFMVPVAALGLSTGWFLAVQIAYLCTATSLWIRMTSSSSPWWIPLTFAIPLVFIYTSFVVPDTWTLAAIIAIVGSFYAMGSGAKLWPPALLFFSSLVLFGFRQNSLVLVPVVLGIIVTQPGLSRARKLGLQAVVAAALIVIAVAPTMIGFKGPSSSASAPAWELVGAIRVAQDKGVPLDAALTLDGIVDTQKAVAQHSYGTIDSILWGADAAFPTPIILAQGDEIKRRWKSMILHHPSIYLQTKLRIYKCMIGLCKEYLQTQVFVEQPWPNLQGKVRGYREEGLSAKLLALANWTGDALRFMLLPIFWIPLTALAFAVSWKEYGRYDRMLIGMATVYLLGFFILTQAASFRYFFPTYVVFSAYQLRTLAKIFFARFEN